MPGSRAGWQTEHGSLILRGPSWRSRPLSDFASGRRFEPVPNPVRKPQIRRVRSLLELGSLVDQLE